MTTGATARQLARSMFACIFALLPCAYLSRRATISASMAVSQPDQLGGRVVAREVTLMILRNRLCTRSMGVRRVDHATHRGRGTRRTGSRDPRRGAKLRGRLGIFWQGCRDQRQENEIAATTRLTRAYTIAHPAAKEPRSANRDMTPPMTMPHASPTAGSHQLKGKKPRTSHAIPAIRRQLYRVVLIVVSNIAFIAAAEQVPSRGVP